MTSSYCEPSLADVWFPTAPGVTALPPSPPPTVSSDPKPANYVDVPAGFDEENPNLCDLFETLLPKGVDPIYPTEVTAPQVLPPYNEVVIYNLRIRNYLVLESFDYSLKITTEIGALAVKLGVTIKTIKIVQIPLASLTLEALPPALDSVAKLFGKVVEVVSYAGTGNTPQQLATQWPASMMLLSAPFYNWIWLDAARGSNAWQPNNSFEFDIAAGGEPGSITFNESNVTVQGNSVNITGVQYRAYIFKGKQEAIQNTAGSIQTTIRESDAFNIISYTGNGANATIGHGLGENPALLIFKTTGSNGIAGGSHIGAGYYIFTETDNVRNASNNDIRGFNDTTISIGASTSVNTANTSSICYAFKQKENQCKIDTYYGNGLAGGQVISCGFNIGLVLVKSITSSGRWLILNEKDLNQGFRTPSWRSTSNQIQSEKVYEFTGDNFTVYSTSNSVNSLFQLNRAGEQYIYMALAVGFYKKLNCPSVTINLQIYAPTIAAGAAVKVTTKVINLLAITPPYIGERVTLVAAKRTNIEFRVHEVVINTGVNIAPPAVAFALNASVIPYVGEVAQDGRTYIAIVESRDGMALEGSMQGCIYRLIKDLKDAGLWSKFLTIVPTCVARTRTGALVPLRGRFPTTGNATVTNFNYNRRTGLKPITFGGNFSTGLISNEVPAVDNHLAAYVNEFNDNSFSSGGDLIGDGFTTNSLAIGRQVFSGSGFQTRNKNSATATSAVPHWSQPSIVGITRQNSSNYIVRVADVNRTITSSIVDQESNVQFNNINMFSFWNGQGNFRVPFYSIGMGLDLAILEGIVETFLDRIKTIGLPDTRILPPGKNLQIEAKAPSAIGRPKTQIVTNSIDFALGSSPPTIAGGYSATVQRTNQDLQGKNPRLAGVLRTPVSPSLIQVIISSIAPSIATGTAQMAPSKTYAITALAPVVTEARTGNLNLTLLVEDDLLNLES